MLFANNKAGNIQQELGMVYLKLLWNICKMPSHLKFKP
jgi:hypothetical protein